MSPLVTSGCAGRYATAVQYAAVAGLDLDGTNTPIIESLLEVAASDLHAALGSVGACDCSWANWGAGYMAKLNIIEAMVFYNAPCGRAKLSDEDKARLTIFVSDQVEKIYNGRTEICAGHTGSDYPAIEIAQMSWTEWSVDELIYNTALKNP